jgi:hypothetical protein
MELKPKHFAMPDMVFEDAITQLNGSEFKLYMFIFRHTYDYSAATSIPLLISLTDFEFGYYTYNGKQVARSGLSNPTIQRGLAKLADDGWITRTRIPPNRYQYAINFSKINEIKR